MGQKLRRVNPQWKPKGGQVSREGAPRSELTKNRLQVDQLQNASNRHQLNAQEPLKPKIPRRSSEEPLCSWSREQQASPKAQSSCLCEVIGSLRTPSFPSGEERGRRNRKGETEHRLKTYLSAWHGIKIYKRDLLTVFHFLAPRTGQIKSNAE